MSSNTKRKLVIDCDAGVDDAEAILIALSLDSVEVVAITTVVGNCSMDNATRNVLRILKFCNRLDIPVYKGCSTSLLLEYNKDKVFMGLDGLGDVVLDGVDPIDETLVQSEHASLALCRMVSENPGQISLVALGPLTNIGLCQIYDPQFCNKLKECVIMGGNFKGKGNATPSAEFNWFSDPEAAYNVLKSFPSPTIVPLETCSKYGFTWEFYDEYTNCDTRTSKLIKQISPPFMKNLNNTNVPHDRYGAWDQMAMCVFIDPDNVIVKSTDVFATVELIGNDTRGQMVLDWRKKKDMAPNVRIVTKLNEIACQKFMRAAVARF